MPAVRPPDHGVPLAGDPDEPHRRALGAQPGGEPGGRGGVGHPVGGAVDEQDRAAGELRGRLARRQPRGEAGDGGDGGWPPTRSAVRPPIEWPSTPIGRPGEPLASRSSAQVASATGDIWSPFQPRTRKRITATAMSPRDSTPICRANGQHPQVGQARRRHRDLAGLLAAVQDQRDGAGVGTRRGDG